MMKGMVVVLLTLQVVLVLTVSASEFITTLRRDIEPELPIINSESNVGLCDPMYKMLIDCAEYLLGIDGVPSSDCCKSVTALKLLSPTMIQRRTSCKCFSDVAIRIPSLLENKASILPKSCGVDVGFLMSKNVNCNSVKASLRQGRE